MGDLLEHDEIINQIEEAILKNTKAETRANFNYTMEKRSDVFSIDLVVLINFKLFLFEIKSGNKETKARKQLNFHKKAFINSQKQGYPLKRNLLFSEVIILWVSYENQKIINTETNKEIDYRLWCNPLISMTR